MTKYYKATVSLLQTFHVNVAAESEIDARKLAQAAALNKIPEGIVSNVAIELEGESLFNVGTRVKHFIFGIGNITKIEKTTNVNNDFGLVATVQFDSGDSKALHLPMPKEKLEVI